MEALAKEGQARLKVDEIAKNLGVTKGSFYHHFKNREDFVESILDFWADSFTEYVIQTIGNLEASASDKLLELMRLVEREGLDRYDIAFRSWAAQDPKVAEVVQKVDVARHRFITTLFKEMGFKEPELSMRVKIWLVYASAQRTIRFPGKGETDELIVQRHRFFTEA